MLAHYVAGNPSVPMVVLVHGVCDGAAAWVGLMRHLSERYFVIAFDSLGHGLSRRYTDDELENPADAAMLELENALEYVQQLYGKKPVVVAHSMGAAINSKLSTVRPDLYEGLILEDPAWLNSQQAAGYRQRAPEQVSASQMWRSDSCAALAANQDLHPMWDAASHAASIFAKACVDERLLATGIVSFLEPWQEIAAAITVPTLVITSDTRDVLVSCEHLGEIRNLNPSINIEIIPGTSHGVRLDAVANYHAVVDTYLDRWLGK